MINQQAIPCPTCKTSIPFDVHLLLQGHHFTCPNCQGVISLSTESAPVVKNTLEKFTEMKKGALAQSKAQKNNF